MTDARIKGMSSLDQASAADRAYAEAARVVAELDTGRGIHRIGSRSLGITLTFPTHQIDPPQLAKLLREHAETVFGVGSFSDFFPLRPLTRLPPLDHLADQITSIHLDGTRLTNLAPLAGLKNLQSLSLSDTPVTDLAPLAQLKELKWLKLASTPVDNLRPLADLTSLEVLNLCATQVSDLSPIAGLHQLERLDIDQTRVSSLAPISGPNSLIRLHAASTPVTDASPLRDLWHLEFLNLNHTGICDLRPLGKLDNLRALYLRGTPVFDLSPLSNLKLWVLSVMESRVADLDPLADMTSLVANDWDEEGGESAYPFGLRFAGCPLTDSHLIDLSHRVDPGRTVAALSRIRARRGLPPVDTTTQLWGWGLPKDDIAYGATLAPRVAAENASAIQAVEKARKSRAREISFSGLVDELPPLTGLPHLRRLDLSRTRITNIAPVSQLSGLKHLAVDRTRIVDLSPIAGLRQLTGLNLAQTDISNLDALAELSGLEWLNIEHTPVADLTPLTHLRKLRMLRMSRSAISDVGPLSGLSSLEYLDISGTQVSDLSPLATLVCLVGAALSPDSNVYGLNCSGCPLSDPVLLQHAERDTPECTFEAIRYLRRKQGMPDMEPSVAKFIWKGRKV